LAATNLCSEQQHLQGKLSAAAVLWQRQLRLVLSIGELHPAQQHLQRCWQYPPYLMPLFSQLHDGVSDLFVIDAFAMKHQQQPA
jgi:hypothetical protein